MIVNLFKIKKISGLFSPHKVLFGLYIIILITTLGLYRWLPISPVLMLPNIILSDWSREPISCWDQILMDEVPKECELDEAKGNILLFGDSHAQQLVFGLEKPEMNANQSVSKKLIFLTSKLMIGNWRSSLFHEDPQVQYIRSVLSQTTKRDVIIFSITSGHLEDSVYGSLIDTDRLQADLVELMAAIFYGQPINGKIVLMLDTPHLKNNVARICSDSQRVTTKLCTLKFSDYERQNSYLLGAYNRLIMSDNARILNFNLINPTPLFCKLEVCSLFDDSGFMLIDGNHIKMSVSHKLGKEFLLEII